MTDIDDTTPQTAAHLDAIGREGRRRMLEAVASDLLGVCDDLCGLARRLDVAGDDESAATALDSSERALRLVRRLRVVARNVR